MGGLERARTVMHREDVIPRVVGHVVFVSRSDDDGSILRTTSFAEELYRDFGEPDQITVTIEPGDLLNG